MTAMPDSVDASPHKGSRTSDYDYELPEERIAQRPVEPRDASRLLVVDRRDGSVAHRTFRDIAELIPAGDAIVVNTTKVFRARLLGHRESGGPAEILLLRPVNGDHYEAMIHPGGKLRPGRVVTIAPDFRVEIVDTTPRRTRIVRLHTNGDVAGTIEKYGHVPLPPYIERADESGDIARYQTVYADTIGSVAAPTAGLHFTPEITSDTAKQLNAVRARGNHVWAIGTTSVRTLETATDLHGAIHAFSGETNIFIRPPATIRGIDRLVTNFHLPKSTLVMLVAAFAGYDLTMQAYRTAVAENYRFYSYGDAMCVL